MPIIEITASLVTFLGLVVSWFALPSSPRTGEAAATAPGAYQTAA